MLYFRGNVPTKQGQKAIPDRIIRAEEARGFKTQGVYRKRLRHFVDGVVIGSEEFVRQEIKRLRDSGRYLRRKNPISKEPHLPTRRAPSESSRTTGDGNGVLKMGMSVGDGVAETLESAQS